MYAIAFIFLMFLIILNAIDEKLGEIEKRNRKRRLDAIMQARYKELAESYFEEYIGDFEEYIGDKDGRFRL